MPPEMQLMIANRVEEKDVLTLNSTCRALRSLVKPLIASLFGSVRTYHLSEEVMAALLALSKDTISAPYLRTLIRLFGLPPPQSPSSTARANISLKYLIGDSLATSRWGHSIRLLPDHSGKQEALLIIPHDHLDCHHQTDSNKVMLHREGSSTASDSL